MIIGSGIDLTETNLDQVMTFTNTVLEALCKKWVLEIVDPSNGALKKVTTNFLLKIYNTLISCEVSQ